MSLAGTCQLKELVLRAEAAEVELWAAAQAVVLLGSTSAALHSQSICCCHQRWDPKVAIQGTHFLERELLGKPKLSVQVVQVFHMSVQWNNGWHEVLGYLEQKGKQSCDGIGRKTIVVRLFLLADQHKKELRK